MHKRAELPMEAPPFFSFAEEARVAFEPNGCRMQWGVQQSGMTNQIHGHEVMQMMVEAQTGFSVESLKAAIISKFGADARFYTCSADNMTADELIAFLAQRGKFVPREDGFSTSPEKICKH